MRILYAIQGTGNGHIARAKEIIPLLQKKCKTDILISGYQSELELPFEIKYKLHGLSFIFGKKGGIDFKKTYTKANIKGLLNEVKELPVTDYDFILNDFEPVSSWASYRNKVPCVALSHQSALLDKNTPKPAHKDSIGSFLLKNYAPASIHFGFHFGRYSNKIYTPIIRNEIREARTSDEDHYTVYLPAYEEEILVKLLGKIPDTKWQVFSKHYKSPTSHNNIVISPINSEGFLKSLITCKGVLCGAGFETPSEAMFLGKKLMVVPMINQYEQQYNAVALRRIGVPVIKKLKQSEIKKLREWVTSDYRIEIKYPDIKEQVITRIFEMYVEGKFGKGKWNSRYRLKPII